MQQPAQTKQIGEELTTANEEEEDKYFEQDGDSEEATQNQNLSEVKSDDMIQIDTNENAPQSRTTLDKKKPDSKHSVFSNHDARGINDFDS